jgi:chemotaxis protein methyltransferase CheR
MGKDIKSAMMPMTAEEFSAIRQLIYDRIGINLTEQKKSLLVGRLQKLVRSMGFTNFKQYYDYVVADKSGKALDELSNRISTNHTFFYRENDHFEYFAKVVLPEIKRKHELSGDKDLRIWCAAASSGEEPYTIVITMKEFFKNEYSQWNAGLLATDISANALNAAVKGVFTKERVKGVPPNILSKYFKQNGREWEISNDLKREVTYRRFNLMNKTFPFKKPFDVIFCRNVMIYFDKETRDTLVKKFYDCTRPGGYLFIGHSESLGRDGEYQYVQPAVYRKSE